MRFHFTIGHVPGKELTTADTLSRAPQSSPTATEELLQLEANAFVNMVLQQLPATEQRLEQIRQHQRNDKACQQITEFCQSGWPDKKSLSVTVRPYFPMAAEFSVEGGLLMRGNRIVIPPVLRKELLDKIHEGHQGITKCRERARQSLWWPGLSRDLDELVRTCTKCCKAQKQRAQPMTPSPLPKLPWQVVGTDLFEWNQATFLLIVDYYSRFIEITRVNRLTADEVITRTKSIFARHGIPETVISDNGPQYASEAYRLFARDYQFKHITSSPYFPQSNGEAERAVQTVKNLLRKSDDPYLPLLAYRTTPVLAGYSPSELLMSRILRSTVPTTRAQRAPQVPDSDVVQTKGQADKARQKRNFDSHHGARTLPSLMPGDVVWLPDRQTEGVVQDEVAPQSFQVVSPDGSYRRNRQDIIQLPASQAGNSSDESESSESVPTAQLNQSSEPRRSSRVPRPPERLDPSWVKQ